MNTSASFGEKLTEFVIDIGLSKPRFQKKIEPLPLMRTLLINAFPHIFTDSGKTTKYLDLAMQYFESYLNNIDSSRSEQAEKLGWSKKSKGAVSNYCHRLWEIGLLDPKTDKFNEKFLLKLYGEIATQLKYFERLLTYTKHLVFYKDKSLEIPLDEPFEFSNSGELIFCITELFKMVTEGEEVFLILKEGRTWASKGVGEVLRDLLKKLVEQKHIRVRVLTSPSMSEELVDFFRSLGEVVVDEKFAQISKRWLYVSGFIVEVLKVKGAQELPGELEGIVRRDILNEKESVAKGMFETLHKR